MKPLSADTPLEVEEVWLAMQRERGPQWRLRRAMELTEFCRRAQEQAMRRAYPEASQQELDLWVATERYGAELAEGLIRMRTKRGFYDGVSD